VIVIVFGVVMVVTIMIVVVTIMVMIVVMIMTENDIVIDDLTRRVDDFYIVQQPVECFGLANLSTKFAHRIVLLVGLADLRWTLTNLHANALELTLEVVVVDGEVFGNGHGTQREIDLDGLERLNTQAFNKAVRVLACG